MYSRKDFVRCWVKRWASLHLVNFAIQPPLLLHDFAFVNAKIQTIYTSIVQPTMGSLPTTITKINAEKSRKQLEFRARYIASVCKFYGIRVELTDIPPPIRIPNDLATRLSYFMCDLPLFISMLYDDWVYVQKDQTALFTKNRQLIELVMQSVVFGVFNEDIQIWQRKKSLSMLDLISLADDFERLHEDTQGTATLILDAARYYSHRKS